MKYKLTKDNKEYAFSIEERGIINYFGKYKYEVLIRGFVSCWKRKIYWKTIGERIWNIKNWYLRKVV